MDWERSVKEQSGFSKPQKDTMMPSAPTQYGLKMTRMIIV